MSTSPPAPTGSFRVVSATGTWTWSKELFAIFGFTPGEVVPTADLILAHQHPDDRDLVAALLVEVADTGRPFSQWHRIRDAKGSLRQVVTVGGGDFVGETLVGFSGYTVDLTESLRRTTSREVDEAMELMLQSRPVIDQAKGALMMRYGVDDEEAFALLRRRSQRGNVKVRDVARDLVARLASGPLTAAEAQAWDELAGQTAGDGAASS